MDDGMIFEVWKDIIIGKRLSMVFLCVSLVVASLALLYALRAHFPTLVHSGIKLFWSAPPALRWSFPFGRFASH